MPDPALPALPQLRGTGQGAAVEGEVLLDQRLRADRRRRVHDPPGQPHLPFGEPLLGQQAGQRGEEARLPDDGVLRALQARRRARPARRPTTPPATARPAPPGSSGCSSGRGPGSGPGPSGRRRSRSPARRSRVGGVGAGRAGAGQVEHRARGASCRPPGSVRTGRPGRTIRPAGRGRPAAGSRRTGRAAPDRCRRRTGTGRRCRHVPAGRASAKGRSTPVTAATAASWSANGADPELLDALGVHEAAVQVTDELGGLPGAAVGSAAASSTSPRDAASASSRSSTNAPVHRLVRRDVGGVQPGAVDVPEQVVLRARNPERAFFHVVFDALGRARHCCPRSRAHRRGVLCPASPSIPTTGRVSRGTDSAAPSRPAGLPPHSMVP